MSYSLPHRKLVSQQDQAMIKRPDVPRSRFTGSWTRKQTFDAGYLVPFLIDEVLPGDHMKYDVTAYVRMATPKFPMFDNQKVDTFFFFVPNRLVWANWKRFMGEQNSTSDTIALTIPGINFDASTSSGFMILADYFGLPIGNIAASNFIQISSLPFRAYNLIYNEWFRDQNLINPLTVNTGDALESQSNFALRYRAKSHDYFTSCLPWPQKFTAPSVALGGLAPVTGLGTTASNTPQTGPYSIEETGSATSYDYYYDGTTAGSIIMDADSGGGPQVYADLSAASGVAINTLRQAWLVQMLLERDARGGTRYTEIVRSHFGVTSPDARLQRPEYIGGGSTPLNITPIAQTSETAGSNYLGSLGGAGTAAGSHRATYASTEHGFIIGLVNVRSELSYSQGVHKMWTRSTRYDFYWPSLAGLGEQAVLRQEIYCTGVDADDAQVFGYQERWHEYRTRTSEVAGLFRPKLSPNIDEWHLSQEFTTPPTLGQTFIEDTPPMSRVLAAGASTRQQYLADFLIRREAVRPIPMFGTPAAIGRF